jgi:MBOAT, membrane-bound O-acyltransferase family
VKIPTAHYTMPAWQARAATPLPLSEYSAAHFFEYMFFPPLYLAGPILTFNAFPSQRRSPSNVSSKQVSMSELRLPHHRPLHALPIRKHTVRTVRFGWTC